MGLLDQYEGADISQGLLQFGQLAAQKRPFLGLLAGLAAADRSVAGRTEAARQREMEERKMRMEEEMRRMQMEGLQQQKAEREAALAAQNRRQGYLGAIDSSQGPALPLSAPQALASGLSLQEIGALMPPKPQRTILKPGEQVFSEDGKPLFGVPDTPKAPPSSVQEFEYGQTNPAFSAWLERNNRAKGSTVNVNTAQNPFFSGVGAFGAKQFEASTSAAQEAAKRIDQNKTILGVLDSGNVYTGAGADIKLAAGKALQAVGINLDKDAIRNTELLATQLAQRTLANIRSSGLGAGNGFTNTDRDFLEKAVGGQIAITGPTLRRLAEMDNRAASATIKKHNQLAAPVQRAAAMQGFPIDFSVPEPDISGGWSIKQEK